MVARASQAKLLLSLTLLAMALRVPSAISCDTWFDLVLGREIVQKGLVERNDLTLQGFGAPAIDQQWLAHCLYEGLFQRFGAGGIVLLAAVCTAGAFAACAWFALLRGATPGRTLVLGLLSLSVVTSQTAARAQTLALPFLTASIILLARDAHRPRRATWALVPCVALWANLHGSVLLAPTMAGLLLVTRPLDAWRCGRVTHLRALARDAALTLAVAGAAFASPYASRLPAYYASTLLNPAFHAYVTEWQAPELVDGAPVYLLVGVALVLLVHACWPSRRSPGDPPSSQSVQSFEVALCFLLAVASLRSVRYGEPLAFAVTAFLPGRADAFLGDRLRFAEGRPLRVLASVLPVVSVVAFAAIPWTARRAVGVQFPASFTDSVADAAGASGTVLSDETHSDRLLWFHPELEGRVSHDARMETLSLDFLNHLAVVYGQPDAPRARALLGSYDVVVVDRRAHPLLFGWLTHHRGWRLVAADRLATAFARQP